MNILQLQGPSLSAPLAIILYSWVGGPASGSAELGTWSRLAITAGAAGLVAVSLPAAAVVGGIGQIFAARTSMKGANDCVSLCLLMVLTMERSY